MGVGRWGVGGGEAPRGGGPSLGETGPAFIWCDVESLPMWAMLILMALLRALEVVGRWAWHRAGSRPGARCPPRGASSELSAPPGGFSAGLGVGGTWEPSGRGHTVARGTVWDADLPLCGDQRGVVFSCQAPDRLLLEREPVPPRSLVLARHLLLQT